MQKSGNDTKFPPQNWPKGLGERARGVKGKVDVPRRWKWTKTGGVEVAAVSNANEKAAVRMFGSAGIL